MIKACIVFLIFAIYTSCALPVAYNIKAPDTRNPDISDRLQISQGTSTSLKIENGKSSLTQYFSINILGSFHSSGVLLLGLSNTEAIQLLFTKRGHEGLLKDIVIRPHTFYTNLYIPFSQRNVQGIKVILSSRDMPLVNGIEIYGEYLGRYTASTRPWPLDNPGWARITLSLYWNDLDYSKKIEMGGLFIRDYPRDPLGYMVCGRGYYERSQKTEGGKTSHPDLKKARKLFKKALRMNNGDRENLIEYLKAHKESLGDLIPGKASKL